MPQPDADEVGVTRTAGRILEVRGEPIAALGPAP